MDVAELLPGATPRADDLAVTAQSTVTVLPQSRLPENYAPWAVQPADYRGLADLVRWAVLAPSSHNTQPWIFTVETDSILVAPDPGRALPCSDPTGRQMYLSLGASIANLKIAAHNFGLSTTEHTTPDGLAGLATVVVRFRPGHNVDAHDRALFEAMARRSSNRGPHRPEPLPTDFTSAVERHADRAGLGVILVTDPDRKAALAELWRSADLQILADPGFTAELSAWLRPNSTRAYDGMPGFTLGVPDHLSRMLPAIARSGKMAQMASGQDADLLANRTAAIGVILSSQDDRAAWLKAGELFQTLALEATALDLSLHVFAALVETEPAPAAVMKLLGTDQRPQMMFRVGYPFADAGHAPRRPAVMVRTIGPREARLPPSESRPAILVLHERSYTLDDLLADLGEVDLVDSYAEDWLSELFYIRHPELDFAAPATQAVLGEYLQSRNSAYDGCWVYFPWKRTLAHLPVRDEFFELLFSRNHPCIDRQTQAALANLRVGIAGLSVGGTIARALAMTGVLHLRIADFDLVAPSNNNRMGAGSVLDVGEAKSVLLARQLYEFNPYLELRQEAAGLHAGNLDDFMAGLDVFIDHLDDLPIKLGAREQARAAGAVVLMATDLAFSPIFDIELPGDEQYFGGRVPNERLSALRQKPERFAEWAQLAVEVFGGPAATPSPVLQNFVNVARGEQNFASQLGLTGYAAASFMAYLVYEIARGNAGKLRKFARLQLQQEDLADRERHERLVAEFKTEFGRA